MEQVPPFITVKSLSNYTIYVGGAKCNFLEYVNLIVLALSLLSKC